MLKIDVRMKRGGDLFRFSAEFAGQAAGVVGASGSGKTTLLHLIAGLIQPDTGSIEILGRTVFDSANGINIPPHQRRVGCVFQDARLFPHLSVEQNIRYGEQLQQENERPFHFNDIVEMLGLRSLLPKRPREISGGEKQRVALARTLLASPKLILFDEPLSNLDQQRRTQLLPFLSAVQSELKIPTLHVSHDLHEVLQVTDQLLVVHERAIAGVGTFTDLVHNQVLLNAPFSQSLCNVWSMKLKANRVELGNCLLESTMPPGVFLNGPLTDITPETNVHVLFDADDVALALEPVAGVSIRNQFPAVMKRHATRGGTVYCELEVGDAMPVLVEVSVGAFNELELGNLGGRPVFCLLKVGAMRVRSHSIEAVQ